jgi:hypothetical protein
MYARILSNADHVRRFSISQTAGTGWDVRDEQDSHVLRAAHYTDWHRVDRARMCFAREAAELTRSGWIDHSTKR